LADDLGLGRTAAFERLQTHIRLPGVGATVDNLGGSVTVRGVVHLVLHDPEVQRRLVSLRVVIDAGGVQVEQLPVEDLLRGADVEDAGKQFPPVPTTARLLEQSVVHGEALAQVLLEHVGRPNPELCGNPAADAITNRQDHIKAVVGEVSRHLAPALESNCSEIPNSCLLVKLAVLEDVLDVLGDVRLGRLKQVHDLRLSQPDRLIDETSLQVRQPVVTAVDDDLAARLSRPSVCGAHQASFCFLGLTVTHKTLAKVSSRAFEGSRLGFFFSALALGSPSPLTTMNFISGTATVGGMVLGLQSSFSVFLKSIGIIIASFFCKLVSYRHTHDKKSCCHCCQNAPYIDYLCGVAVVVRPYTQREEQND
jgi:hypothetical protein